MQYGKKIRIEVPLVSFDVILTLDNKTWEKWKISKSIEKDCLAGITLEFEGRLIIIYLNIDYLKKNNYNIMGSLVHEISHAVTFILTALNSTCDELRARLNEYLYEQLSIYINKKGKYANKKR